MTVHDALDELTQRGHGSAEFEVNATGELIHVRTVFTVKFQPGEDHRAFIERIHREQLLQQGDYVEFPSHGGKFDVARIIRKAS
jgi:hypothetical protein